MSSPEIMRRIAEAEKGSKQTLERTSREIAQTKKDLPYRIASIRKQILEEVVAEVEKVQAEGERSAGEEAERIASEARRQVESLSKIPETKRRQAVERTMQLLLS